MKLLKLTLENFRVFHGVQELDLEVTDGKPAVLVFGMNGAGKTTLLNAFGWALYGTFSDDVEYQERVINDHAWSQTAFGTQATASVRLVFEHEGRRFHVLRSVSTVKNDEEQRELPSQLSVTEVGQDGESRQAVNGQDRIEKILPRELRQFFFFNGERMERMFAGERTEEVKQAIKTLMGLEEIERAIEVHLPKASAKLARQVEKGGDTRLQKLVAERKELEASILAVHNQLLELSKTAAGYEREVDAADKALRSNDKAAPLARQRVKLEERRRDLLSRRDKRFGDRKAVLAKSSFLAFTGGLDAQVLDLADGMRQRRELPAGIQRDFIDGLLEDNTCMCGRDLPTGSEARKALEERRYNAGLADVQTRWMYLAGKAADLANARTELLDQLRGCAQDIEDLKQEIDAVDIELSDIARQLEGVDVMDVRKLEERRKEFDRKRIEALQRRHEAENQLPNLQEQLDTNKLRFHGAERADAESRRIQSQVALVDEVLEAFLKIRDLKTEEVRRALDTKVKDVFARICIKPFTPAITPTFSLQLVNDSFGAAAARSTGENQILGLSFVGAVSELAKEIDDLKQGGGDETLGGGGIYPVVMDAPFGNLDVVYQDDIAEALPKLTSQIVALLSQSQSRGQVLDHLGAAASRMYVLRSYTTHHNSAEQTITIHGRSYPYVSHGEFDHTALEEVTF
ncbi:AAA family ATPase [Kitasatospora sp. NPDC057198]|uniref:AAA family ATPase n=1 Tax=Kitasatospora sp. NPDC057198 TaxID=3346046 RepID=UPI00362E9863